MNYSFISRSFKKLVTLTCALTLLVGLVPPLANAYIEPLTVNISNIFPHADDYITVSWSTRSVIDSIQYYLEGPAPSGRGTISSASAGSLTFRPMDINGDPSMPAGYYKLVVSGCQTGGGCSPEIRAPFTVVAGNTKQPKPLIGLTSGVLAVAPATTCGGGINLSWNSEPSAVQYELSRDGGSSWSNIGMRLSYSETVTPDTTYTYRVRALTTIGYSDSISGSGKSSAACTSSTNPGTTPAPGTIAPYPEAPKFTCIGKTGTEYDECYKKFTEDYMAWSLGYSDYLAKLPKQPVDTVATKQNYIGIFSYPFPLPTIASCEAIMTAAVQTQNYTEYTKCMNAYQAMVNAHKKNSDAAYDVYYELLALGTRSTPKTKPISVTLEPTKVKAGDSMKISWQGQTSIDEIEYIITGPVSSRSVSNPGSFSASGKTGSVNKTPRNLLGKTEVPAGDYVMFYRGVGADDKSIYNIAAFTVIEGTTSTTGSSGTTSACPAGTTQRTINSTSYCVPTVGLTCPAGTSLSYVAESAAPAPTPVPQPTTPFVPYSYPIPRPANPCGVETIITSGPWEAQTEEHKAKVLCLQNYRNDLAAWQAGLDADYAAWNAEQQRNNPSPFAIGGSAVTPAATTQVAVCRATTGTTSPGGSTTGTANSNTVTALLNLIKLLQSNNPPTYAEVQAIVAGLSPSTGSGGNTTSGTAPQSTATAGTAQSAIASATTLLAQAKVIKANPNAGQKSALKLAEDYIKNATNQLAAGNVTQANSTAQAVISLLRSNFPELVTGMPSPNAGQTTNPPFVIGPSQPATPTAGTLTQNLSRGSTGPEVIALQTKLASLGYLEDESISGFFGPLTEAAVKKFQCDKNIVCVGTPSTTGYGMVGPSTRAALNGANTGTTPAATLKYEVSNSLSGPWTVNGAACNDVGRTVYTRLTGVAKSNPPKGCADLTSGTACLDTSKHRSFTEAEWPNSTTIQTVLTGGLLQNGAFNAYISYPGSGATKVGSFELKQCAANTAPVCAYEGFVLGPAPVCNPTTPTVQLQSPGRVSVQPASTCGGGVVVSWDYASGATSYELSRNGGSTWTKVGNTNTYTDTGSPSTSYTYMVRSVGASGAVSSSNSNTGMSSAACAATTPTPVSNYCTVAVSPTTFSTNSSFAVLIDSQGYSSVQYAVAAINGTPNPNSWVDFTTTKGTVVYPAGTLAPGTYGFNLRAKEIQGNGFMSCSPSSITLNVTP